MAKLLFNCKTCGKEVQSSSSKKTTYCSRACANKDKSGSSNPNYGNHYTSETINKLSEIQKKVSRNAIKAREYDTMSEEQARAYFNRWKASGVAFVVYCHNVEHKSHIRLMEVFKKYFPDEVKIHSDDMQGHNTKYKRGRAFEYAIMERKEKEGFFCMRSAGSHSPIDIIAIKKGEIQLIQTKIGNSMQRKDREALLGIAESVGATPIFIQKVGRGAINIIERDLRLIKDKSSTK